MHNSVEIVIIGSHELAKVPISNVMSPATLSPTNKHSTSQEASRFSRLNILRVGGQAFYGWSDVNFTLSKRAVGNSKKNPTVINGLQGKACPGEIIAIMGASGCGKTSLLNVLSGRFVSMNGHVVTGNFTINGQKVTAENLGNKVAFVTQEDNLCPKTTPREALEFSARLRLSPSVTDEERKQMVDEVISLLRLEKCADTLIGDELIKGISGGEKRRTSIGIELVTSPSILFLDEPTSGLDSFAAFVVVNVLRDLASLGCTILCTIHQPSSEVFHLFDRVLLMSEGRTFYDGPTEDLSSYLSCLGYPVPPETNPADHIMFLMQNLEKGMLSEICDEQAAAKSSEDPHCVPPEVASAACNVEGGLARQQAGVIVQFMELGKRDIRIVCRDAGALCARFGTTCALNLLFGVLFLNIGDFSREDYEISSHFGALYMTGMSCLMGASQPTLLMFPSERPRIIREFATGTYQAAPYFWSKLLTELPLTFATALLSFLICFWMMNLHGSFILHVLIAWLMSVAGSSICMFIGCIVPDVQTAILVAPGVFVPQILFAGLFIKLSQIPAWIRWAQYLCSLKFGMNLFMLNEFGNHCDRKQMQTCDAFLEANEVDPSMWWGYALILFALFMLFRVVGLVILARKARGLGLA